MPRQSPQSVKPSISDDDRARKVLAKTVSLVAGKAILYVLAYCVAGALPSLLHQVVSMLSPVTSKGDTATAAAERWLPVMVLCSVMAIEELGDWKEGVFSILVLSLGVIGAVSAALCYTALNIVTKRTLAVSPMINASWPWAVVFFAVGFLSLKIIRCTPAARKRAETLIDEEYPRPRQKRKKQ